MAIITAGGKTIVYCPKGILLTQYKPELYGSYGMFESYRTPTFYWIVKVFDNHVEFLINTPMFIEDAFRIIQEHNMSREYLHSLQDMMFEDFDKIERINE